MNKSSALISALAMINSDVLYHTLLRIGVNGNSDDEQY